MKALKTKLALFQTWVPPGHYYSPIPDLEALRKREADVFGAPKFPEKAVDLNDAGQVALLHELANYYPQLPFGETQAPGRRYYYQNPFFSHPDAIILYALLRHLAPDRVIEIGSGFSSAVMLDTNEQFLNGKVKFTFIEPYPDRLFSLLRPGEKPAVHLIRQKLEEVPLSVFEALEAGDVLFIDSTHVSKAGSDVNYYLFEIFPLLKKGVYIHIHDIFYPFEYPREWIYEGRAWNEIYALRAFLSYNAHFKIVYFNHYMGNRHAALIGEKMPLCLKSTGGSIWLQKQ